MCGSFGTEITLILNKTYLKTNMLKALFIEIFIVL